MKITEVGAGQSPPKDARKPGGPGSFLKSGRLTSAPRPSLSCDPFPQEDRRELLKALRGKESKPAHIVPGRNTRRHQHREEG